jgi:hypothetical protein
LNLVVGGNFVQERLAATPTVGDPLIANRTLNTCRYAIDAPVRDQWIAPAKNIASWSGQRVGIRFGSNTQESNTPLDL